MTKSALIGIVFLTMVLACQKNNKGGQTGGTPNEDQVSVLTQHNNNSRSGWNDRETVLTVANVNSQQFGKLFSLPVDDQVYAQPLVATGVTIGNSRTTVVYVATVNNSLYAFDADNGTLYWQKNYTYAGMRPPTNSDMTGACGGNYHDFSGKIGIVSTPVIDSTSQIIYFVARSTNGNAFVQYLHAVNIGDGSEMPGSPVKISATYSGNGDGNINNVLNFDAQKQNQRQALTLLNGIVYVGFSSHCDWGPYHGWILGYNSQTLQQEIVYNDTPDGYSGGIWECGMGMASDAAGNLYVVTGNGKVGVSGDPANLRNRGETAMKLTPNGSTLSVTSFFTPSNYLTLESNDLDYGTMGAFLVPGSNRYFTSCKDGNLYLLDKDNMGGYSSGSNQVVQTIFLNGSANMHCHPAFFQDLNGAYIYVWSENDPLRALPFDFSTQMIDAANQKASGVAGPTGQSGAVLSVSSNGMKPGTGILWAAYASTGDAEHDVSPGILRAFDAADITHELWNNRINPDDISGNYAKFCSPTIANGHVYLATFSNQVMVYGLK